MHRDTNSMETLMAQDWMAMGTPSFKSLARFSRSGLRYLGENSKPSRSRRLHSYPTHSRKPTPWATNTKSSITFSTDAMTMNTMGRLDSPMPRRIAATIT